MINALFNNGCGSNGLRTFTFFWVVLLLNAERYGMLRRLLDV